MKDIYPQNKIPNIAAQTDARLYILPHPMLRGIVSHYTVYFPQINIDSPQSLNIIPDASGCLVFSIFYNKVDITFWGPTSSMVTVDNSTARPLKFFVEFLPGGACSLLQRPMKEFHNSIFHFDDIDPVINKSLTEMVGQYFHMEPADIPGFIAALDQLLLRCFHQPEQTPLTGYVLSEAAKFNGSLPIKDLVKKTGYSPRHLNRLMKEKLGISMKLYSRILRINHACRLINNPSLSLTNLAHLLNYHDQAHFIHDFKAICGSSPSEYRNKMSLFYNEDLKICGSMPQK